MDLKIQITRDRGQCSDNSLPIGLGPNLPHLDDETIESLTKSAIAALEAKFPNVFQDSDVAEAAGTEFPGLEEGLEHGFFVLAGVKPASIIEAVPEGFLDEVVKRGVVHDGRVLYLPASILKIVESHPDIFPNGISDAREVFAQINAEQKTDHIKLGLLLGFPKAATEWYLATVDEFSVKVFTALYDENFEAELQRELPSIWELRELTLERREMWVDAFVKQAEELGLIIAGDKSNWQLAAQLWTRHASFKVGPMTWADRFDSPESSRLETSLLPLWHRIAEIQSGILKPKLPDPQEE